MPLEKYLKLVQEASQGTQTLFIPSKDVYTQGTKVHISNVAINSFNKRTELAFLTTDNRRISQSMIDKDTVTLATANPYFFALCTSQGSLHVYSSRTFMCVAGGIQIEGVCMMESSHESMTLALLTLKGALYLFRVINPDASLSQPQCQLLCQTTLTQLLKKEEDPLIVKAMKLGKENSVGVTLSDGMSYFLDLPSGLWSQVKLKVPFKGSISTQLEEAPMIPDLLEHDISSVLEAFEDYEQYQSDQSKVVSAKECKDNVDLYRQLGMKDEFLYSLKLYCWLLLRTSNYHQLTQLFLDYRFVYNKEQEALLEEGKGALNKEIAHKNVMNLIQNDGKSRPAAILTS